MCEEHSTGTHPMMHAGPMPEIWERLTEEQKKKVAVMRMDLIIQWMEIKIEKMEKMIHLKKKAIADIRQVQEMIKTGK
jgi:hypothetical protein